MTSPIPGFDEFCRLLGRFFIAWSTVEESINAIVRTISEKHPDEKADRPRNFSKKTEFIRRHFSRHHDWGSFGEDTCAYLDLIDGVADIRNAMVHGVIVNMENPLDFVEIELARMKKGKDFTTKHKLTLPLLFELGNRMMLEGRQLSKLAVILRFNPSDYEDDEFAAEIASEAARPLPVTDFPSGGFD